MNQSELFLEIANDLQQRIDSPRNEYALLKASGLLRQLLVDNGPFVILLNREYRVPLRFKVMNRDAGTPLGIDSPGIRWVNTNTFDFPFREVKVDDFLAYKTIAINGETYTVKQVIKCVAHTLGGVHYYRPEDDREERLMQIDSQLQVNEVGALCEAMAGIAVSTLEALKPLITAARSAA
jgi:hypothetical protein